MKIKISKSPEVILSIKALGFIVFLFLLYLVASFLWLRFISYEDIKESLGITNNRVVSDLIFKDGQWDTSAYVNDEQTPGENPLYVFTADGFVIERSKTINGFLDTSDFKFSSSFTSPQTITTPANEKWRLYSKPIVAKNGTLLGTVLVGYYNPELSALKEIDEQLKSNASTINSQVKVNDDNLDIRDVDVRKVGIEVSFEIVDRFNHALKSIGGIPAYIDRSYINGGKEISQTIQDKLTGGSFLVSSKSITDNKGNIMGVVIAGRSLMQVNNVLKNQLTFSIFSWLSFFLILILLGIYFFQRELVNLVKQTINPNPKNPLSEKVLEVDQKFDGTVLVYLLDKKYKVTKPELDSDSDKLIGKLMELSEPDRKEIEYNNSKDSDPELRTSLSRLVTRLGFSGLLRKLFFPRTSKQMVKFRKYLTQNDLSQEGFTLDQVKQELIQFKS